MERAPDDGDLLLLSAHRRFQEWSEAGVFLRLWQVGLVEYGALKGIDWAGLSMDGAMTKAPLGGKKVGTNLMDPVNQGTKRSMLSEGGGMPIGLVVAGANRNDFKLLGETIESIVLARPWSVPIQPGSGSYAGPGEEGSAGTGPELARRRASIASRKSAFSAAQRQRAAIGSCSLRPSAVSRYSVRGGTTGCTVRSTSPASSRDRST